jgi:hypothetical protein
VKVLANLIMRRLRFTMLTWDISGAYYFGTLPCPDTEGGMV